MTSNYQWQHISIQSMLLDFYFFWYFCCNGKLCWTVNVETSSITRYQDLSPWQLSASDIKSLCKSFLETGKSAYEFANRHTILYWPPSHHQHNVTFKRFCGETNMSNFNSDLVPFDHWRSSMRDKKKTRLSCPSFKNIVKRTKINNSFVEVQCQFKTNARSSAESTSIYSPSWMRRSFLP
jgi:hypothetical protein